MIPRKVAIIGGGYSGVAAYWAMRDSDYEVYLFEAHRRLGSLTKMTTCQDGWRLDTALNIFKPSASRLWQVFLDAVRFNYFALDMLRPRTPSPPVGMPWPMDDTSDDDTNNPPPREPTIREYLDEQGYSRRFRVNYVFPLLCALWNVGNISDALNLPIKEFVRCLWDNDLLTIFPWMSKWATIANGNDFLGQINRIIPPDRLRLRTRVISVHSEITGLYIVRTRNGGSERREKFDRIIFALPGQEALRLLKPDANNREKQILGGFQSERVIGVLHTDRKLMPATEENWAIFNYVEDRAPRPNIGFFRSYNMNLLWERWTDPKPPTFITLNPTSSPDLPLIQDLWEYSCPIFNVKTLASQKTLHWIQNRRGISYCGSWTGHGLPEDGIRSAFQVVTEHFGIELPFPFEDSSVISSPIPDLNYADHLIRLFLSFLLICIGILSVIRDVALAVYNAVFSNRRPNGPNGVHHGLED